MSIRRIILFGFSLLFTLTIHAQEMLELQFNEAVKQAAKQLDEKPTRSVQDEEPLSLPVFDDFSTSKVYPNPMIWEDRDVFVNKNAAYRSVNTGTATFDAVDDKGVPYIDADWIPFEADHLTSKTIRLDSIFEPFPKEVTAEDSIYLSFFYQPQGVGNAPEPWDTLVVEFNYYDYEDLILADVDSIIVLSDDVMAADQDTIFPSDTIYSPESCDPNLFMISVDTVFRGENILVPCHEYYEPSLKWNQVWHAEGMKLEEFKQAYGRNFVQVILPVTDTMYFHKDFKFRFMNYASIANEINTAYRSNVDQWNVDYVFLDENRSKGDTTYRVLSFSESAPSFLKHYQVMPYRQYLAGATVSSKTALEMYITNLDKVERNTFYKYTIDQVNGDYSFTYGTAGNCNLKPSYLMENEGFQNCDDCAQHACPPAKLFALDFALDTAAFVVKHYISDSSDTEIIVDSSIYHQGFYNYFAYDDGTPEAGIGMSESGNKLAAQFTLNVADTLRGVQMYFNRTVNDANAQFFDLIVWRDNNGQPGEEAFRLQSMKPRWEDGLYHFYSYVFDEPIILSGNFYVGMEQFNSTNLNIGFDRNNDASERIFYNDNQGWYTSTIQGAPMIRPMIGPEGIYGINDAQVRSLTAINIYPNPTTGQFSLDQQVLQESNHISLSIHNMFGAKVHQQIYTQGPVDVSKLSPGMYTVRVLADDRLYMAKVLISR